MMMPIPAKQIVMPSIRDNNLGSCQLDFTRWFIHGNHLRDDIAWLVRRFCNEV